MSRHTFRDLAKELVCAVIGHEYFVLVHDEGQFPRRKCERCGAWAEAKGWHRR